MQIEVNNMQPTPAIPRGRKKKRLSPIAQKKHKEKVEKVLWYFERLFELRALDETIYYKEIGNEVGDFHRHVNRSLGYIHTCTDVYNEVNGLTLPHIPALIINKKYQLPGDGCHSTQHDVFKVSYKTYLDNYEGLLEVLNFVLKPSYDYVFKTIPTYENQIKRFCELFEATKKDSV